MGDLRAAFAFGFTLWGEAHHQVPAWRWEGLSMSAHTGGVVALRLPRSDRTRIPGGTFEMGSRDAEMRVALGLCQRETYGAQCARERGAVASSLRAEGPAHDVTVSTFFLDRLEVDVGHYNRCVASGSCAMAGYPQGDHRFDRNELPVTHVRWVDAATYCRWIGGRLPTEAEWEYAAEGPRGRRFPWGNLYNPHLANHGSFAPDSEDASDGFPSLAPVGSFPDGATPNGVFDLAGNAAEWVLDWLERDPDGNGYPTGPQTNPQGPSFSTEGHVVRGGSYLTPSWMLRTRSRGATSRASSDIGFRCAYDLT